MAAGNVSTNIGSVSISLSKTGNVNRKPVDTNITYTQYEEINYSKNIELDFFTSLCEGSLIKVVDTNVISIESIVSSVPVGMAGIYIASTDLCYSVLNTLFEKMASKIQSMGDKVNVKIHEYFHERYIDEIADVAANWTCTAVASVINVSIGLAEGVFSFSEAIVDTGAIVFGVVGTLDFGLKDIIHGVQTGEWNFENTNVWWNEILAFVGKDYTTDIFSELNGEGTWLDTYSLSWTKRGSFLYEAAKGVGYYSGVTITALATGGTSVAVQGIVSGTAALGKTAQGTYGKMVKKNNGSTNLSGEDIVNLLGISTVTAVVDGVVQTLCRDVNWKKILKPTKTAFKGALEEGSIKTLLQGTKAFLSEFAVQLIGDGKITWEETKKDILPKVVGAVVAEVCMTGFKYSKHGYDGYVNNTASPTSEIGIKTSINSTKGEAEFSQRIQKNDPEFKEWYKSKTSPLKSNEIIKKIIERNVKETPNSAVKDIWKRIYKELYPEEGG